MNDTQQNEAPATAKTAPVYQQVAGSKVSNNEEQQPRPKKTSGEQVKQQKKEENKDSNGPSAKSKDQKKNQQKKNKDGNRGKKQQQSTLNLNAPTFVFGQAESTNSSAQLVGQAAAFPLLMTQTVAPSSTDFNVFNVDAPVFKPKTAGQSSGAGSSNLGTSALNSGIFNIQMAPVFTPQQPTSFFVQPNTEPISGYKNPFAKNPSNGGAGNTAQKLMTTAAADKKPVSKIYTIEFMLSLRATNKDRPANMALLDFPHKKKRQMKIQGDQMTEADKFNHTVRELRILLNKLSKDNFDNVTKHILNDYTFTPALLNELMKIIFMKATTEKSYLELYVRLCILLFRKYNDKENVEMNFKKLLLSKCQKQFQKLQAKEEEERRSRKASMEIMQNNATASLRKTSMEEDFNKQMLFVYDTDEIKHRQRMQRFGNMSLLVELYIQRQIQETIIKTCIETMLDEDNVNDLSVEILVQMMFKIAPFIIRSAVRESQQNAVDKKKKTLATSQVNLSFLETTLSRIFSFRNTQDLSSRVRFKVQDLIDEYQKEWKGIIYGERNIIDDEGFQYRYVPKEAAAITKELEGEPKKKDRKQSNVSDGKKKGFVYVKKQQPQPAKEEKESPVTPMQMLLGGLKADDEETKFRRQQRLSSDDGNDSIYDDDDEDYKRIMNRKVSMNEQNVTGQNFEKYNREEKPSPDIRRKIGNFVMEYKETKDRTHAKESFQEMCSTGGVPAFNIVGYILHNAFSFDQAGWNDFLELIIDHLFTQEKLVNSEDLLEGVHVSLANFIDTLIDYPMSRFYAGELFDRLGEKGILQAEQIKNYKLHVENLEEQANDDDSN